MDFDGRPCGFARGHEGVEGRPGERARAPLVFCSVELCSRIGKRSSPRQRRRARDSPRAGRGGEGKRRSRGRLICSHLIEAMYCDRKSPRRPGVWHYATRYEPASLTRQPSNWLAIQALTPDPRPRPTKRWEGRDGRARGRPAAGYGKAALGLGRVCLTSGQSLAAELALGKFGLRFQRLRKPLIVESGVSLMSPCCQCAMDTKFPTGA